MEQLPIDFRGEMHEQHVLLGNIISWNPELKVEEIENIRLIGNFIFFDYKGNTSMCENCQYDKACERRRKLHDAIQGIQEKIDGTLN